MSGRRSRREPAAGLNPSQEELMLTGSFCLSIFHALIETKSLPSSSLLPDPDLPFETIDFLLEEQGRSKVTLESYQLTPKLQETIEINDYNDANDDDDQDGGCDVMKISLYKIERASAQIQRGDSDDNHVKSISLLKTKGECHFLQQFI
ncbi:hypothetical protein Tco_0003802 [Tanacetum coccineum]